MGPKILTVDDSKTIRMIVSKAFRGFACVVFEACNGVEGLAVASREKPDIIILDYTMPIMDGFEMLTKLKSDPELKTIPVIMLTAEAGRETVLKIAKLGVRDYMIKPFKEEAIIERVGRVIDLKPKTDAPGRIKRYDDPLQILIVDDKPAIVDQIRNGLAGAPWTIEAATAAGQAVDFCNKKTPDVVFISLSLPDQSAFTLYQMLRSGAKTKTTPIFALSVRTATEEQGKAQQVGFTGIVTKPIDFDELKSKITRSLGLDTSYKYFQLTEHALILTLPGDFSQGVANDVTLHMRNKVNEAVDSGLDKMIMDLSQLKKADIVLIKLGLSAIQVCHELSLKYAMIGSEAVSTECKNYEETKGVAD